MRLALRKHGREGLGRQLGGAVTAQARMPEGSARIEPRCDMSAKRKPPLP